MAITLWRTRAPFEGLLRWFDDDFFSAEVARAWTPAIDVKEKDGAYLVKADLPGLKKDDIHIELRDSVLTLRGERRDEHEEKKNGYHRIERTFGSFERSLRVPEGVTEKDIHAKYTDGVLELSIPAPAAKEPKAIEIKVE
jgi:HSP20 family protein